MGQETDIPRGRHCVRTLCVTNKKLVPKNDLEVPVRNCRTSNVKYVHHAHGAKGYQGRPLGGKGGRCVGLTT